MKTTKKVLGLATMLLTVAGMVACGGGKTTSSGKCTHKYVTVEAESVAATCTTEGKKVEKCEKCGDKKETTVKKAAHKYEDVAAESKDATCTEAGKKVQKCANCPDKKETVVQALGHDMQAAADQTGAKAPTCTEAGTQKTKCSRCPETGEATVQALGHEFGETVWEKEATCTEGGVGKKACTRTGCDGTEDVTAAPLGHDVQLIGDDSPAPEGEAKVRVYTCANNCGQKYLGFQANEVTNESKSHLVIGEDGGARFFGRPIGNDLPLDEEGTSVNQEVGELVFNENQPGDFFEYKFTLTKEQAATLPTSKLYCDAKPAAYMGQNNVDFWAYGADSSDWTPGAYVEGENKGELVNDFRYILYVDGQRQDLDAGAKTPVQRGDPRAEYVLPYTFKLHEGVNTIRLVMAGGYRSTFYKFTFRAVEEQKVEEGGKDEVKYEFTAAECTEGQKAPSASDKNTRLGKNNIFDDVWSIEGKVPAGKYALYINAQASANNANNGYWNSVTAVANGGKVDDNGGEELAKLYKYTAKIDSGAEVNMGASEDNYAASGLSDSAANWTTKALCELTVGAGAKTLTIHNNNNGYSIWVFAVRLVKVA